MVYAANTGTSYSEAAVFDATECERTSHLGRCRNEGVCAQDQKKFCSTESQLSPVFESPSSAMLGARTTPWRHTSSRTLLSQRIHEPELDEAGPSDWAEEARCAAAVRTICAV